MEKLHSLVKEASYVIDAESIEGITGFIQLYKNID